MKSGTLDSMKFKLLMRDLGESVRGTAGILEVLWQRACKDCPRGDIGRFTNEEIAVMADYEGDADALVAALVARHWFDESEKYRLVIHDWHDHAPNWVKALVKRLGGFFSCPEHSVPHTKCDTHSAAPPSQAKPSLAKSSPPPTPSIPVANPSAPDPEPLSAAWSEVVVVVEKCGVGNPEAACESARDRGASPSQVRALCEHFAAHPGAWGVGLLYRMIEKIRPEQKPSWPAMDPAYLERQRVASVEQKHQQHESAVAKQLRERKERQAERDALDAEAAANPYSMAEAFEKLKQKP